MTTRLELARMLKKLDTNEEEIKILMHAWEDRAIPIYDKIRAALDQQETNVILLAIAAVIGQFAKDIEPDNTDSVVDMFATIAKARLFLLQEVALKRQ